MTLKDTVTLEYTTAAATLGTGAITLGAGTTFAFVNSGNTLTLPSAIVPPTGADEKATLRINGDRLRSSSHTILSGVASGAADHLTIDPESTALAGRKFAIVEKDGNLVLEVKSKGLIIIFR